DSAPGLWIESGTRPSVGGGSTPSGAHSRRRSALGALRLAAPQLVDPIEDRVGDRLLGVDRELVLVLGVDERDRILLRLEADLGIGDVVEDDQVGALAHQLVACPARPPDAVLGGEADDRLALAALRSEAGKDVLGGLEVQVEPAALALDLALGDRL